MGTRLTTAITGFSRPSDQDKARPISVLYIHHSGAFSGAARSLFELIRGFPPGAVKTQLITQRGDVQRMFSGQAIATIHAAGISCFDNTQFGYYRGKRWLVLVREIFYAPCTLLALLRARLQWRSIDIIHVNEIVALPAAVIAKAIFCRPIVIHVRSVQRSSWAISRRGRMLRWMLEEYCDAVIAIDERVRRSLPAGLRCHVVHNGYAPGRPHRDHLTRPEGISRLRVGMIGNLLPLKGVYEFVEVARLCRARGLDVEFIIAGANPRTPHGITGWLLKRTGFAADEEAKLQQLISKYALDKHVCLLGHVDDICTFYDRIDLLCFLSHLNAVGRPVYEAAFMGIPSIVMIQNPEPDTLIHGTTGIAVPPGDVNTVVEAIEYLSHDRSEIYRMGDCARQLAAKTFDRSENSRQVLEIYRMLL